MEPRSRCRRRAASFATCMALTFFCGATAASPFWNWHDAPCDRTWMDGHVGRQPAKLCSLSMTVSPYHLGYPILFYSVEARTASWLGITAENAFGTYKRGAVTQLGLRLPVYPVGDFDGGLQIGPFVRASFLRIPNAGATDPPSTGHAATAFVFNDVEFARANGRNAVYSGFLVGGKYVAGAYGSEFSSVRGLTVQGGFLIGYHRFLGSARHGPHPDAAHTDNGFLPQLYVDVGYSL